MYTMRILVGLLLVCAVATFNVSAASSSQMQFTVDVKFKKPPPICRVTSTSDKLNYTFPEQFTNFTGQVTANKTISLRCDENDGKLERAELSFDVAKDSCSGYFKRNEKKAEAIFFRMIDKQKRDFCTNSGTALENEYLPEGQEKQFPVTYYLERNKNSSEKIVHEEKYVSKLTLTLKYK
ncbi:TPA: hypothetical protein ACSP0C_002106 [Aeromonas veronii]